MPREKISVDPIGLAGVALTLMAMTAAATAFISEQTVKSENVLLRNQVSVLEDQITIRDDEIQEQKNLLKRLYDTSEGNQEARILIEGVLKERTTISQSAELRVNEALIVPGTKVAIAYENFARYPLVNSILGIFPGLSLLMPDLNAITITDGSENIVNNIFPRAGSVLRFEHDNQAYRLVILLVQQEKIALSVIKDEAPRLKDISGPVDDGLDASDTGHGD